jgi:hypothetical protein
MLLVMWAPARHASHGAQRRRENRIRHLPHLLPLPRSGNNKIVPCDAVPANMIAVWVAVHSRAAPSGKDRPRAMVQLEPIGTGMTELLKRRGQAEQTPGLVAHLPHLIAALEERDQNHPLRQ